MIEYRSVGGEAKAEGGVLRGLVTPFNVWTTIGDKRKNGFDERVAIGTFKKTLQERDVILIDAHDTSKPMARTSIREGVGSLTLREEPSEGLTAEARPVDTSYARDVMACADAGVTRGMSFGFEVIKDSWTDDDGNPSNASVGTKRTIHEVRLHEVTTTAFPAYETTQLAVRDSIAAARGIEMTEREETRDAVDGDDPNAEFFQAFTNGAISDLEQISTTYSHQLPANVADAIMQICAFYKSLGEHVPAAGGTGGDGITPPSPEGPTAEQHSAEDEDWEMRARVAMVQAQTRMTEYLFADLAR